MPHKRKTFLEAVAKAMGVTVLSHRDHCTASNLYARNAEGATAVKVANYLQNAIQYGSVRESWTNFHKRQKNPNKITLGAALREAGVIAHADMAVAYSFYSRNRDKDPRDIAAWASERPPAGKHRPRFTTWLKARKENENA